LESGHQNEGDAKRRLQTASDAATSGGDDSYASGGGVSGDDEDGGGGGLGGWGEHPIPQQPLSDGEEQWYRDTCPQSWS